MANNAHVQENTTEQFSNNVLGEFTKQEKISNKTKHKNKENYSFGERFAFESIKSLGFTTMDCIAEFIDNSIDAGAKNIHITWERDLITKYYELTVKDDGCGVPTDKMYHCFTELGQAEDYDASRVGFFGVGIKASFINLMPEGTAKVLSRCGEDVSILSINHEDKKMTCDLQSTTDGNKKDNGVIILIPNIDTQLSKQMIMKTLSVMYYPNKVRDKEFNLTVNGKAINFIDPMYRGKDGLVKYENINQDQEKFKFMGEDIEINYISFLPSFDWDNCSKYDNSNGKPSLQVNNSGLYVRLGGRYISLGEAIFPGVTYQTILQNLRMEIELDKDLLVPFGVQINKSKLEFDLSNPLLEDFKKVIKTICASHVRKYSASRGKKINQNEVENLKQATKALNKVLKSSGREKSIVKQVGGLIEKREFKGRNNNNKGVTPKGSGKTRSGNNNKPRITKAVDFEFISDGNGPMYGWSKSNGTLIISLNRDHKWVALFANWEHSDQVAVLWKIYSWIHAGLIYSQQLSDDQEYVTDMFNLINDESQFLEKWLSKR